LHIHHLIKAIDESNKNGYKDLANNLNAYLFKYQNKNNNNQEDDLIMKTNPQIDKIQQSILPNASANNLQVSTVLDDELHLIENLDDLTSLLSTDNDNHAVNSTNSNQDLIFLTNDDNKLISNKNYQNLFSAFDDDATPDQIVNLDKNVNNESQNMIDLSLAILNNSCDMSQQSIIKQQQSAQNKNTLIEQSSTPHLVAIKQDDQDKKIKTLADNIIAAMPYKIKTNSYNSSNNNDIEINNLENNEILNQINNSINHNDLNEKSFMSRPLNYLRRNATSFDDGYSNSSNNRVNSSPLFSNNNNHRYSNSTSCYSSSTRSSLSPTSSTISFHLSNNQHEINSPAAAAPSVGDESTCSSTFHIDSPPSTAEFCQYFHASSSSSYYKNAIETGFAQLTLTDDEQRELYEAALVIQNAYRRYIQRKKKKIRLDPIINEQLPPSNSNNSNTLNSIGSFLSTPNHLSLSRSSSASLSSLNSNHSIQSSHLNHNMSIIGPSISDTTNKNNLSDDDNNSTSSEDQKQYEAACIIQKYYRRYKQFENLHKYTEAAVKIQTRYRAYKSSSSKSSFQYRGGSSSHQYNKLRNYCHHNSIDEALIDDSNASLNEEDRRMNRSDLQLNSPTSSQFQKKIARKLINHRQSPRFSPAASPLSPSPSQSNNVLNSNSINVDSTQSNSQQLLHHHHHHHHHFHHHFHNSKNENQDQIQIMNTNSQDSNQSIYTRYFFLIFIKYYLNVPC
jgi:hypothetical protein